MDPSLPSTSTAIWQPTTESCTGNSTSTGTEIQDEDQVHNDHTYSNPSQRRVEEEREREVQAFAKYPFPIPVEVQYSDSESDSDSSKSDDTCSCQSDETSMSRDGEKPRAIDLWKSYQRHQFPHLDTSDNILCQRWADLKPVHKKVWFNKVCRMEKNGESIEEVIAGAFRPGRGRRRSIFGPCDVTISGKKDGKIHTIWIRHNVKITSIDDPFPIKNEKSNTSLEYFADVSGSSSESESDDL